ncbi:dTDP-4-dehydrorhamnose 3,5-epimerase [Microbacterium sp. MPKO10]|uniref:dTDP-4-dehydrorhamnose 3,5-epimerase n=1 Tax=Microbacterium sp. MPKO10 TaxID=2989818 RepID=UPI00223562B8|nr:dTDP-4-dehydrorhamnose 3,5-epimerase [Microbacterium sp. MPKO10]MCW4458849.1 dTDP-4-dehydrorhamnose 3,5-epimerase [Microbacterium sp. MPKO10]
MKIIPTDIEGLVVFEPTVHRDERGYFTRILDVSILADAGIDPASFKQENQSRSYQGVVRGLHGRMNKGEAKLVRCAHGAVLDIAIDARPGSPTFGEVRTFLLDDQVNRQVYIPRGFLHGYQALTSDTDFCYRIDDFYGPDEDITISFDDPDLAVVWPAPITIVSERDRHGISWHDYKKRVGAE